MNQSVTTEEFQKLRQELSNVKTLTGLRNTFIEFRTRYPQKYQIGFQNEDVLGNYLLNCKDAFHCFDCRDLRDGRYCFQTFMKVQNAMDIDQCGEGELLYECSNLGYNAYNIRFSINCLNQIREMSYCDCCFNGCKNLFACIGLKRQSYCILNKQYSKQQYQLLEAKIIAHMKETKEWGEFFPAYLSPFGYNLTVANNFYPLNQVEVTRLGFNWHDETETREKKTVPDIQNIFRCVECSNPYRIIKQEQELYNSIQIALPQSCFGCRHKRRLLGRNPRKLWQQPCQSCGIKLEAAFDPVRGAIVYCEDCYLRSLE